ncbi:MAG: hypothetical protein GY754_15430 [bacterium]|nr:hypothetical protein [bacterium]
MHGKNIFLLFISITIGIVTGCGNMGTNDILDGDFLPGPVAESDPPAIISPLNNERIINDRISLKWKSVIAGRSYTVTIARDDSFTEIIYKKSVTPDSSQEIILPNVDLSDQRAGTCFWKVHADVTRKGEYSESSFTLIDKLVSTDDVIYVYFPHNILQPNNTGRTGSIQKPYQTIKKGIEEAKRLGIAAVKVASRGKKDSGEFAAYNEFIILEDGVSLLGGYDAYFSNDTRVIDPANNTNKTIIQGSYAQTISAENIESPTLLEGLTIQGPDAVSDTTALYILRCSNSLETRFCRIMGGNSEPGGNNTRYSSYGVLIHGKDEEGDKKFSPKINNNIISGGTANFRSYGLYNYYGSAEVTNNSITAGESNKFNYNAGSYGIFNEHGTLVIINNTITGGKAKFRSYGLYSRYAEPVVANNTITGGAVEPGHEDADNYGSYGMFLYQDTPEIVINNIITTVDTGSTRYGVKALVSNHTINYYHYNCIYTGMGNENVLKKGDNGSPGEIITDNTNIFINPQLDPQSHGVSSNSPCSVKYGGYDISNDVDSLFTTAADFFNNRTTAIPADCDPGNGGSGWSIGAYEYDNK